MLVGAVFCHTDVDVAAASLLFKYKYLLLPTAKEYTTHPPVPEVALITKNVGAAPIPCQKDIFPVSPTTNVDILKPAVVFAETELVILPLEFDDADPPPLKHQAT